METMGLMSFGSCSKCQLEIPQERLGISPIVCPHCGATDVKRERAFQAESEKKFLRFALSFTAALVSGFIHIGNWDKHSASIIPLKIKQVTGLASTDDLNQIENMCRERKRYGCVEEVLSAKARAGDLESYAALGKLQMQLSSPSAAAQNLARYFAEGGLDLEASYQYAKALQEVGKIEDAASQYDRVLKAKPGVLQVTVAQNYVRMLMNNGRRGEALNIIKDIRKSSPSASLFMNAEFQQLTQASFK